MDDQLNNLKRIAIPQETIRQLQVTADQSRQTSHLNAALKKELEICAGENIGLIRNLNTALTQNDHLRTTIRDMKNGWHKPSSILTSNSGHYQEDAALQQVCDNVITNGGADAVESNELNMEGEQQLEENSPTSATSNPSTNTLLEPPASDTASSYEPSPPSPKQIQTTTPKPTKRKYTPRKKNTTTSKPSKGKTAPKRPPPNNIQPTPKKRKRVANEDSDNITAPGLRNGSSEIDQHENPTTQGAEDTDPTRLPRNTNPTSDTISPAPCPKPTTTTTPSNPPQSLEQDPQTAAYIINNNPPANNPAPKTPMSIVIQQWLESGANTGNPAKGDRRPPSCTSEELEKFTELLWFLREGGQ